MTFFELFCYGFAVTAGVISASMVASLPFLLIAAWMNS